MNKRFQFMPSYQQLWRWHFFASIFTIPFILMLSITGSIYLFKPQIERWQTSHLDNIPDIQNSEQASGYETTLRVVRERYPQAEFVCVEIPEGSNDASARRVRYKIEGKLATIFVHPVTAEILRVAYEENSFVYWSKKIHGELLIGDWGSHLVETAACWSLVMVLTGLALWMPAKLQAAGTLWPRWKVKGRQMWKDLHSVSGFWLSGLIVFLIVTGLPWASFWGDYFKKIRTWTGTAVATQDWSNSHANHAAKPQRFTRNATVELTEMHLSQVDQVVVSARLSGLAAPILISPKPNKESVWTIKSDSADRPRRDAYEYDTHTGKVISTQLFSDRHWVDRAVSYGIALHEGQRFGLPNQLLALLATTGLVMLSFTGVIMWWRRREQGLAAPPKSTHPPSVQRMIFLGVVIGLLSLAMPLFGSSLLVAIAADRLLSYRRKRIMT